ncbi:AraC family transcriptional regulator [Virgibacillus profundi]|uniref:AraC family transcriptional regulator n=1 Tax=Virgibacillus profundi TaxID=2024555 RepID=A0A2A2IG22_9BACI|nr:helix-turn-helix transcriptional regulator [Virgibacillus profundi]PAV30090.1 AraC family transcriptional regulator [Virgibacillus profundi]PXY54263.1 AraC family transcriptional regulator [Virgibacillus profundi]
MAIFRTYHPQPPLSDFIRTFWLYKGYKPPHEMERVLPDGSMELVINLEEDLIKVYDQKNYDRFKSFSGSLVSGPHSNFAVIDTACQASTMGVHFKPGGTFPFFNLPADELRNEQVSLDTLWGPKAAEIREQLLEAESSVIKFRIIEHHLLEMMDRDSTQHPAVMFALMKFHLPHELKIADINEQINLSPRRFIQVFKNEVGLTPKQFSRIQRFQKVLQIIKGREQVNWTDIAFDCGYYDQAHFIHDFKSYSGLSPKSYHLHHGKQQNHVPFFE